MDNKNTLIGTLLIGLLLLAFIFYSDKKKNDEAKNQPAKPKTEQTAKTTAPESTPILSPADSSGSTAAVSQDSLNAANEFGAFATAVNKAEQLVVAETDLQKITFSTKGGFIKSVELKKYKTWDKKPLILFDDKNTKLNYSFSTNDNKVINTSELNFEPSVSEVKVSGTDSTVVSFKMKLNEGQYIEQVYTLKANDYSVGYSLNLVGLDKIVPASSTSINADWNTVLKTFEKDLGTERRYSALYFKYKGNEVAHLKDDGNEDLKFDTPLEWISFKQQFFNTSLISPKGDIKYGKLKTYHVNEETNYVKKFTTSYSLPFKSGNNSYDFKLYMGPNGFQSLSHAGYDLQEILKLGPDFFLFSWVKYITRFIIWIFSIFDSTGLNYGIIILIMTILLKIALHPFTYKSYKSAASMKLLQPELAEIKAKYGDDQTRIGQEQMKLYSRAGVSPFGGCLPLVLQMPILMAMYYFFPASIELRQESFLWATDLSSYDAIVTFSSALPLIGSHISLFTILMTISSILQAVMNSNTNNMQNQQPGMQYLPYIMPVMLMFVFNSFPAALTYYYLLQNVIGMGQQWIIQKFFIDEKKLHAQIEQNKKNPKPKSALQKKLEEIQNQAADQKKGKK